MFDPERARVAPMRTVVVIDDDDDEIRTWLAAWLKGEGFQVSIALDAKEALTVVGESPGSVVLLDLLMPHEGAALLVWLQAVQGLGHQQIVLMSASVQGIEVHQVLEAGSIAAFLPKPFHLAEVMALVKQPGAWEGPADARRRPRRSGSPLLLRSLCQRPQPRSWLSYSNLADTFSTKSVDG
jgi:CheY-like chemotaxis protein